MSRRAGEPPYPRSLTYAVVLNVAYGAITLAATTVTYVMKTLLQTPPLRSEAYSVFLHVNVIYGLSIFLMALLVWSNLGHLADFMARRGATRSADDFFSKGFFVSALNAVSISLIVFGTAVFALALYGLIHAAFLAPG